jgi:hypothetical protein
MMTLIPAPPIAADIGVVVRGTAMASVTGVLMGVSAKDWTGARHQDERDHPKPEAVGHGWGAPPGVGIAADQRGWPC